MTAVTEVGSGRPLWVRTRTEGGIAWIEIDHPPVNVLSTEVLDDLADALGQRLDEAETRVIILSGPEDRGFAAGADIRQMAALTPTLARLHALKGQAVANLLELLPFPVIAAVHGSCLGGGSELVEACDLVVASEEARFGQPEINLGVIPGWGGTRRLSRILGPARAREWILLGEPHSASEAREAGLVFRVVPRVQLLSEARGLAERLSQKPPEALAAAKYAVNHALDDQRFPGLEFERKLWGLLFATDDQKEGMKAFLEKRKAKFQDRRGIPSPVGDSFPWGSPGSLLKRARALARLAVRAELSDSEEVLAQWAAVYAGEGPSERAP